MDRHERRQAIIGWVVATPFFLVTLYCHWRYGFTGWGAAIGGLVCLPVGLLIVAVSGGLDLLPKRST